MRTLDLRKPGMFVLTVTPDTARTWLDERNVNNRRLTQTKVDVYARDMLHGRWAENGETVKFDWNGNLLDGQHRLQAIVQSNVTLPLTIVSGLNPESQLTIDAGIGRSFADNLQIDGVHHATVMHGALAWLHRYQLGKETQHTRAAASNWELQNIYALNPGVLESVPFAVKVYSSVRASRAVITALHYILSNIDDKAADEFFRKLADGVGLRPGEPVLTLRNWFNNQRNAKPKMPAYYQWAVVVKAWNATRQGRDLKQVKWDSDREDFPRPI